MEVDALLIMVLAVIAWQYGKAGAWIVLAGAMRYLFVAAGCLWRWLECPLPPSRAQGDLRRADRRAGCRRVAFHPVARSIDRRCRHARVARWSFGVDVLWLRRHGG